MTIDITPHAHAWPPPWARDLVPAGADVDESARYLAIEAGGWPARSRPPTGARSRWSCSRRWIPAAAGPRASISRRSAPAWRGSASPMTIAWPRCGWPKRASRGLPRRGRRTTRRLPSVHRRRRLPLSRTRPASGAAPGRCADRAPGQKRQPDHRHGRAARQVDQGTGGRDRRRPPAVAHRRHRRARHGKDRAHRRHRPGLAGRRPQQRAHRDRGAHRQGGQSYR